MTPAMSDIPAGSGWRSKHRYSWSWRGFPAPSSRRDVPLDRDLPRVLPRFRHVVGELHPEKVIHVRAERLFDAQGHFRRQRGLAVQKVGKRGAAYFQNLRRLRYVEAEGLDDFGFYQVARMGRVLHGHFGLLSGSRSGQYRWRCSSVRLAENQPPVSSDSQAP